MAYGLRFYSEFAEFNTQKTVRVEIHERDYSGPVTEVQSGGTPLVIRWADDFTDDPFEPMRPQTASIEWISDEDFNIQSLFITDEKQFQVRVLMDLEGIWWGYVSFTDCQEPYHDNPYPVTISADCGLSFLQKHEILDPDGKWHIGPVTPMQIIADGLFQTGLNLWIHESVNLSFIAWLTPNAAYPLSNTTVDGDGLRGLNYYDYIRGMLNACGAFLTQVNEVWVIQDVRNQTETAREFRVFDASGTYVETIVSGQQINIIPPAEEGAGSFIRPTEDVIHRLALPKSKIICDVDPGIAVNRLANGVFKSSNGTSPDDWIVYGGATGKDLSSGEGTLDNPYKLDMSWNSWAAPDTGGVVSKPIVLNIGNVTGNPSSYNIRIKGSCIIRGTSVPYAFVKVTLNLVERELGSYLDSSGAWQGPMKHNKLLEVYGFPDPNKLPNVSLSNTNALKTYEESAMSQLDFESGPITNWVNESGIWKAYIRVDIAMPPPFFQAQSETPRIWVEDFAVIIDTKTPYEGGHTYELDATSIILDGEEYQYTVMLAEKHNITTLEQKRDENRVMTNYLMAPLVLPGETLYAPTAGFYRIIGPEHNSDPHDPTSRYPIQHLGMKERIRLLCGKRSLLDGVFFGYGFRPSYTLVNTILGDGTKYIPTSWEWDVKDAMHSLVLRELDFQKLDNEEIKLVVEGGSGRRSRISVSGSAGTTGSTTGNIKTDPIVIDDIPIIAGIVDKKLSASVDIEEYILSNHEPSELTLRPLAKPSWATVTIPEDTLEIDITGTPDQSGDDQVLIEVSDGSGDEHIITIPITIYPSPSLTYTLNSTKLIPSQPVTLPHTPPYTLTVQTKGGHDAYRWVHRFAGAVQYDSDIIPVSYTENAIYTPISAESLAQGIHVVFFQLFRQTGVDENDDPIYTVISGDDLIFKLGSAAEDPYRTVKLELMAGGVPVGEIPNTFAYIEEWDIRPTPTGIKYDELFLSVLPEEEPYTNTLTPTLTGVSFGLESEILDGSNGATSPDAGYQTTDAIPVVAGQEFWLGSAPYSAAGYNSGSFVTELSGEVLTIPAGVSQIRICWANGSLTDVSLAELIGTLFGGDAPKGAGNFTVFVRARFGGSQEYERMAELIVLEKEPEEPIEQEGITLIQPGNPLVKLVDPLPIEGAVIPLPPAFGLLFSGFGAIQYDKIAWKLFQGISGMSEVSLPMYTGQPSEKSYGSPVTAATQLLFWGKDSTEIGTIHQAPNRFLAEVIATLKGEKVTIAKADWIFSNTPIGPDTGMTYGYYDPSAQVLSTMVPDVPATGGIYKLVKLAGQGWVVGALTWNSSTQYNKVETEVNGVIVHTWTGALKSSNTVDESFDWNRSVPGLDDPGEKTIKQRFYNGVTLIGTKEATITFYPEDPEIKDPNECCSGGGDSEGISVTIGNGTDNLYGIPHPYGDRPLVVSVYRASDMAQTYPGIRTPTGMVWVSFKSPLAVNARIVVIRPI